MNRNLLLSVPCLITMVFPKLAFAGMPSISFTQLGRMRIEEISFFVAVFLLASWGVKGLWNYWASETSFLPRISYRRSLALMGLWGLVFVVVLTMISGARELMTPQAWEYKENGWTHQLVDHSASQSLADDRNIQTDRIAALIRLHSELVAVARKNNGLFPKSPDESEIEMELWTIPDRFGLKYSYVPDLSLADVNAFLAHEPLGEGSSVLTIRVNGEVVEQPEASFRSAPKNAISSVSTPTGAN